MPIDRPPKDAEKATKEQGAAKNVSHIAHVGASRLLQRAKLDFVNVRDFHAEKIEAGSKDALATAKCACYAALAARHAQVCANAANAPTKILAW